MCVTLSLTYRSTYQSYDIFDTYIAMMYDSEEKDSNLSTRVNAVRLPQYIGRHVRLACKVLKVRVLLPYPVFELIIADIIV